jgi:hypothetical protein
VTLAPETGGSGGIDQADARNRKRKRA